MLFQQVRRAAGPLLATEGGRRLSSFARALPDFIILGTMKGGTTSLFAHLAMHERIVPSRDKEVHFFDNQHGRGVAWYRAQFPPRVSLRRNGSLTGEASPYYLFHPLVPNRVREIVPDARLIVLLRDPVKRAWSHYMHEVASGMESLTFEEAIDREEERLEGEVERMKAQESYYSFAHQHYSYLSRGLYAQQIERWWDHFPRNQLLVLRSEDLYQNASSTVRKVTEFLGLPPIAARSFPALNSKASNNRMNPATALRLKEYFRPHNQHLFDLLRRDFGWEGRKVNVA